MSDYTPTTEEVRAAWINAHRVDTPLGGRMDMGNQPRERVREFDRWLAAHDAQKRAELDEMFLMQYGMSHASFVGSGGDAIRLDITREAWKDMGEPEILTVGWAPVKEEE